MKTQPCLCQVVAMVKIPFKGRIELITRKEADKLRCDLTIALRLDPISLDSESIRQAVCNEWAVTNEQLESDTRETRIRDARYIAIWLNRIMTTNSLREIGAMFPINGTPRYHGTIHHSFKRVEDWRATDPKLKARIDKIQNQLTKGIQ